MSSLKKRRVEAGGSTASEAQVRDAAKEFYDWLGQEHSALRGLLSILSADNVFYTGFAAEKVTLIDA